MDETPIFCVNHPSKETALRCNRCGDPICAHCAVRTPVGYRCRKCVRDQQKVFETARWYDFPAAFVVSVAVCGIGSIVISFAGFFILFIAAAVGALDARAVQAAVRYRRGRWLWLAAAAGGVAGCLPVLLPDLVMLILTIISGDPASMLRSLIGFVWPLGYMIIAVGALIAGIRGIRL